ncbi:Arsenite-activated ATPase ArsA [Bacillus cereus BDRD-ST24]|nr:Arsenite-activated ATPase ArsA [Bacillus cereus BDRD-ST24]
MVFLADWFSAQKNMSQITDIKWHYNHYGPFVNAVYKAAKKDKMLIIKNDYSAFGSPKEVISFKNEEDFNLEGLSDKEIEILDDVINETKTLNWSEFINLVYSTYPVKNQPQYSDLDLVKLAMEEKKKIS